MNDSLKRIILNVVPPAAIKAGKMLRDRRKRRGALIEWEALAEGVSRWKKDQGWSHPSIVEVQCKKWSRFLETTKAPKQFGAWPGGEDVDLGLHNLIMTFGYVLGRAAEANSTVSVLDWGGGLGHYNVYARGLHPELTFDYVIKDLPIFCEAGRSLLPGVQFIADDDAALARHYDLVFASSSVHYSCRPYETIGRLAKSATRWLMITRLPCLSVSDDFVVVQRPIGHGYMTEYPCWFVNRKQFIQFTEGCGFVLRREFLQTEAPFVLNAPEQCRYTGFLFERNTND